MLCAQSFRAYAAAVAAHLAQRQLARDLVARLDRAPVSARPLRDIVAQLPRLLDAEQACAFLIRAGDGGRKLEFFHGARMPAGIRSAYARWLPTAPKNFAGYDPASPAPRQRNRPLRSRDIEALTRHGPPAGGRRGGGGGLGGGGGGRFGAAGTARPGLGAAARDPPARERSRPARRRSARPLAAHAAPGAGAASGGAGALESGSGRCLVVLGEHGGAARDRAPRQVAFPGPRAAGGAPVERRLALRRSSGGGRGRLAPDEEAPP